MTSTNIYHYMYRITNIVEKKYYYGRRSSKIEPKLDIGIKYFSSSKDKEFMTDQKLNPQNYKYKIVQTFSNMEEAIIREIKLHSKFDVKKHVQFYNKANQTSTGFGFDHTGLKTSDETKAKLSKSNSGKIVSEETRSKMSKSALGKRKTKATREKMSKAKSLKTNSSATREKMAESALARHFRGYFVTPYGIFAHRKDLVRFNICSKWCFCPLKKISKVSYSSTTGLSSMYSWEFLKDKTFGDIGFGFISAT